jgi:serine/threonine-protein kinase
VESSDRAKPEAAGPPTPIPYGRYLLLERLAVGGMAEVWLALPRGGDRFVAVKRILPTLAEDGSFIRMFLDEARLVAQLDHPGIVPIQELGRIGEGYFFAMEYVAGRDLRALLARERARGGRLPVALAVHVVVRLLEVLDHAHKQHDAAGAPLGIVHRDVSPANVLLGFDGSVRLIDFGIARAAFRAHHEDAVLRGKFGYMSPEAVSGRKVDRRADVFSAAVVLHELLTGERLFTGPSELAVMERVRAAEVKPPSARNPEVLPALDAAVLRALARDPGDRFAWASDLADALRPFARRSGDSPALARLMARAFTGELRRELDRLEALVGTPWPAAEAGAEHERTQVEIFPLDRPAARPGRA